MIPILEFVYRYRRLWVLTAFLSVVVGTLFLILLPRKYKSDAKLIVKVGRESVTLDPTATTSQTMLMQKTQEEEINSALEVVFSRRVKESVIERIGVDAILSGCLPDDEESKQKPTAIVTWMRNTVSSAGDFLTSIGVRDPVGDYERAINELDQIVHVSAPKMSRVISIYTEAESPELAQAISGSICDAYIKEHMKISQTTGSFEFFEEEAEKTEAALQEIKAEMARFMSERQIVSVESNQELLKNAWNEILANILRLESLERELASTYSATHPRRSSVVNQLKAAKATLDRLNPEGELDGLKGGNAGRTVLTKFDVNRADAIPKVSDMASRIESLIHSNNELEGMQENYKTMEARLELHRMKLEEARLIKAQKAKSISNISVFQPATLNEKPISPNKPVVGLGTIFLGFCLAGAFALFREATIRNRYFHNAEEIENSLKLPVVAQLKSDREAARKTVGKSRDLRKMRDQCCNVVHQIVQLQHKRQGTVLIGILGFDKNNGASTVAASLSACCSKDFGLKTLLVDADRKRRSVAQRFSLNGKPGLHEFVQGESELADCMQRSELFDLSLVSSTSENSPPELDALPIPSVVRRIRDLSQDFDVVIVDLPSATASDSMVSVAPLMDHVILVAEASGTNAANAVRVLRNFEASQSKLLGVILNKCRTEFPWQKN